MDAIKHPIGSRIRFLDDITGPASGDHPAYIYAKGGDLGRITDHNEVAHEGYWVTWDGWDASFGASDKEFEVVNE